jgi:hypothetical protein
MIEAKDITGQGDCRKKNLRMRNALKIGRDERQTTVGWVLMQG